MREVGFNARSAWHAEVIPVVDLFAGPGGLNEGFSALGEEALTPVFRTIASVEMDTQACATLTLRSTFRHLKRKFGRVPAPYYALLRGETTLEEFSAQTDIKDALRRARSEVHQLELGIDRNESDSIIRSALAKNDVGRSDDWVLLGGPPCQAYSLVGRSRRKNDLHFEEDKKHFLYREYLHILDQFQPAVFVMENVKGLLSATNGGQRMFEMIKKDLENAGSSGYDIYSFAMDDRPPSALTPSDFILRAELYGVPQRRHRVILLGIRRDRINGTVKSALEPSDVVSVADAIGHLPRLRSGITPTSSDSADEWYRLLRATASAYHRDDLPVHAALTRAVPNDIEMQNAPASMFEHFVSDPDLKAYVHHETRAHMRKDLERYWYAAAYGLEHGISPRLRELPESLLPNHANAKSALRPFEDRFRVQVWEGPATTITSHISKDGHYYIHPDPSQMRSLTVREAARLQSFPDNYYFVGNRTQKYHQVGNAVPPLLAKQIAEVVSAFLSAIPSSESTVATQRALATV